nr:MAG TPA: hypothetical protein [Caudoviricetes sp.]
MPYTSRQKASIASHDSSGSLARAAIKRLRTLPSGSRLSSPKKAASSSSRLTCCRIGSAPQASQSGLIENSRHISAISRGLGLRTPAYICAAYAGAIPTRRAKSDLLPPHSLSTITAMRSFNVSKKITSC